jgi:hypothetical protein
VHGGDRLPWVADGDSDNFASLAQPCWHIHVYGVASHRLIEWCAVHRMLLYVFPWTPIHDSAGLTRDALYLLRPDAYVALVEDSGDPATLDRYLADHCLRL